MGNGAGAGPARWMILLAGGRVKGVARVPKGQERPVRARMGTGREGEAEGRPVGGPGARVSGWGFGFCSVPADEPAECFT